MGKLVFIAICGFYLLGITSLVAQTTKSHSHDITITIPEVALIDLETTSSSAFTLSPTAPNEAGNAVDFSNITNSEIWINYSSIVGNKTKPSRKVSAVVNGTIPKGVLLNVIAMPDAGAGDGKVGTPVGNVRLSNSTQDIITNIGSCYTGDGINKGHRLTYSLKLDNSGDDYASLNFNESAELTVTYTLADSN